MIRDFFSIMLWMGVAYLFAWIKGTDPDHAASWVSLALAAMIWIRALDWEGR